jgi:hypothetical protein
MYEICILKRLKYFSKPSCLSCLKIVYEYFLYYVLYVLSLIDDIDYYLVKGGK